jgi:dTMP kinase
MDINLNEQDYQGALIVFCGVDGSGKTTMMKKLENYLSSIMPRDRYIFTKQPRDIVRDMDIFKNMMYTKNPNVDYRAVVMLTLSERIQHCHEEIIPALKEGKIVISDRYIFTTIANMIARGYTDESWFFDVIKHIPKPDIAFLAHVDPELAINRILSREEEKDRYLDKELLRKVSANYENISKEASFIVLDTSEDPKKAFNTVKEKVDSVFKYKCMI